MRPRESCAAGKINEPATPKSSLNTNTLQEYVSVRPTWPSSARDSSAGTRLTMIAGFSADGSNSGIGLLSAKQKASEPVPS